MVKLKCKHLKHLCLHRCSSLEDKDFILELIKTNPNNLLNLDYKVKLWKNLDFAKEVLKVTPKYYFSLFPKKIQKELK